MTRILSILLIALSLSACDKVVSQTPVGEPFWDNRSFSGSEPGFCYHYGYSSGEYRYRYGYSSFCSCSYDADALIQTKLVTMESGKTYKSEDILEKKNESDCQ